MKKTLVTVITFIGLTAITISPVFAEWAAIAYSKSTGRYGTASDRSTAEEAAKSALNTCNESDCQVTVTDNDACIAFAVGYRGVFAASTSLDSFQSKYSAEKKALENCNRDTVSCELITSVCSE